MHKIHMLRMERSRKTSYQGAISRPKGQKNIKGEAEIDDDFQKTSFGPKSMTSLPFWRAFLKQIDTFSVQNHLWCHSKDTVSRSLGLCKEGLGQPVTGAVVPFSFCSYYFEDTTWINMIETNEIYSEYDGNHGEATNWAVLGWPQLLPLL